ncbi:two-component system, OmpR family, sensor histidine kinase VanS [Glycomyces harbinensis]|uniref:histidine kinase n=2 Tax=Glycomyces harbinensis TaxID=58114 RepID=A0A1G6XYY4_9ACTN|nr:HAMP domain-containing sensor histidine kinase [Glycomyces harbinensis]SDD82596.1 two-component system, OmpR family, sensor histidine kinase VanS [Glycomyces harbinensis]
MSARLKLALSYAGFLMVAGALLLVIVWVFLLRYAPREAISLRGGLDENGMRGPGFFIPGRLDLWEAFYPKAGAALGLLLVLGLAGGWFLAGRMLAPLNRIAAAARLATGGSLSHRIRMEGRNDEFRELADAFDAMLERLDAHVAEQQRFAANASHELRTPLAISQTMLDVARSDPARRDDELLDRLYLVNARAIELTEALLLMSRSDQRTFTRERVDLSLVAEEAAETLLPLAERRGAAITVSGDVAAADGSHALLLQMATNLVHNAIVHNLDDGGTVRVATAVHSGHVVFTVENTGPMLTPHLVSTLTEPFQRGTRRIRSDHPGVGLGLAIVKSIVGAHDGTLALAARPEGGLRVEVRLPLKVA